MRVRLFQVHYLIRFVGRMHPKWIVNFEFYFVYVKKIGDHHRGQVGYFLFCLFVVTVITWLTMGHNLVKLIMVEIYP